MQWHGDHSQFREDMPNDGGAGITQWYSTGLQTGWLGVRVPAEAGNFSLHHRVQTGSEVQPASLQWIPGLFLRGWSGRSVKLTTHLRLEPRSRMRGSIPPLPKYAFMSWCSVIAQGQLQIGVCNIKACKWIKRRSEEYNQLINGVPKKDPL
jgi:hypothetical protein